MAYGSLEDPTGRIEIVIFPKTFAQFQQILKDDSLFMMEGRLDLRRDVFQFSVNTVTPLSLESMIKNAQSSGLYDPNEKIIRKQKVLEQVATASQDPLEEDSVPPPPPNEDWKENPFTIEVPATIDMKVMEQIRSLLSQNPGERRVEIHISIGGTVKKMKLPGGIQVTEDLQKQLKALLG